MKPPSKDLKRQPWPRGAKGLLIPPDTAQRFVADIAGAQMVIFDDLGHVPHEEDGPKTVEAFKLFVSAR